MTSTELVKMDKTFFPDTALYPLGVSLPSKGGTGWNLKGTSPGRLPSTD